MRLYIEGVGVTGSGMASWEEAVSVLTGKKSYTPSEPEYVAPDVLPPNERRRSVRTVRLAIQAAKEAVDSSGVKMESIPTVFASCLGDGLVIHSLFNSLSKPGRVVSPTAFHNSVHNAPVGYWLIGAGCMEASTSIACNESTFGSAFMESAAQLAIEANRILLVAYDIPSPKPLHYAMPFSAAFAVSLCLSGARGEASVAVVEVGVAPKAGNRPSEMTDPGLEALRAGNPAARSLPLCHALANKRSGKVFVEYSKGSLLELDIEPLP